MNSNQNTNKSSSLALDLESLNSIYKNLLTKYKQSVLDYIDNLNAQSSTPCGKYTADSKGIDQKCYDEIWKKAGCKTTDHVKSDNVLSKKQTLNQLIYDSFLWATMRDDIKRKGCYGITEETPYYIIGVGTNGKLYMRQNFDSNWNIINDDANDLVAICTGNDGKMIIASTKGENVLYKGSYDASKWINTQNNYGFISLAMGQDGSLVGVGNDNKLYTKPNLNGSWSQTASGGEYIKSICIAPDDSIFCIDKNNYIYKKDSYKDLTSGNWEYMGKNTCCVKAITIAPDGTFIGVGTDNQLYIKDSYKFLNTNWKGPYKNSCCVIGITTIANPNYNTVFNTTKKPNYNINSPILTEIKGQSFWGTNRVSENVSNTLQECSASCSNTPNCTGATFNSDKKYCWLREGEGTTIPSKTNDYAIVPKSIQLLKIVESLNNEIIVINRKMQKKINEVYGVYGNQVENRLNQNDSLINQYDSLNVERDKINSIISEYQTLEEKQNVMELYITKNYYLFFIFFIIAFIAGIILAMSSVDQNTTNVVAFSIINPAVAIAKTVTNNVNPFYVMFGIILLVVISYLYNRYITYIYNNTPSFKNMGQLGIIYLVFAIVIIFITINYFTKNII
jgi:hypothetical protein